MRASDKISLIDKVGRELQSRFRYQEIDAFLAHYGVKTPTEITTNSKWVYSKEALAGVSTDTLLKIAEELDIEVPGPAKAGGRPPQIGRQRRTFAFSSAISRKTRTRRHVSKRASRPMRSAASLPVRISSQP
jgi:hypothetical protein